jgi:hypothetical protein
MAGFWRTLETISHVAANRGEFLALDSNSDKLIKSLCYFDPSKMPKEFRDVLSDRVRVMYLDNYGEPWSVEEIAAFKMLAYKEVLSGQAAEGEIVRCLQQLRRRINKEHVRIEIAALDEYKDRFEDRM